ncbi:MAG TPA: glycosyltransferase family 1 protein [Gammaproteobacteria bacterium]|jgi:glycosyltransferase involved in cell wall biosynthesis|nr:glycosyltransferase family 1 protein [Gammaproteobacteria bacterium]
MQEQVVTLNIDMTGIIQSRINTGIQRVVKEFVKRALLNSDKINYRYLQYNQEEQAFHVLDSKEIGFFLDQIEDYQFEKTTAINLFQAQRNHLSIFFDMDSAWNIHPKRLFLYPRLKANNYTIVNYLYDLSPVIMPQYSQENTCRNFITFLTAVYSYSDMVYFDSASAERDFLEVKSKLKVETEIPTHVTGLGSDYSQATQCNGTAEQHQQLLQTKYILFVGTIEPRKDQEIVLDAFEVLAKRYPDLSLVFIGKQGWKVERFLARINKHPLKGKRFFYLDAIDDATLSFFYKQAWLVIYLSKLEGYGLPIAESLRHGNITIASKNSSMYEVGRDFADYINYNSRNEIIDSIALYYENTELYEAKKRVIKEGYKAISWDVVAASMIKTFQQFPIALIEKHKLQAIKAMPLQFIFISIDVNKLQQSITEIDRHVGFVKEYIVITKPELLLKVNAISTKNTLITVDENSILGDLSVGFSSRDHQQKNWLLRAGILNLQNLDEHFVMLDDDNRPLKKIEMDYFISKEGRYNAYYFYDLLNWNSTTTDYDKGQANTRQVLTEENHELLAYSSHAPQIINKRIFSEVIQKFLKIGLKKGIDEWSIYFNYAVSNYPYLFNKRTFQTLNWPASPTDWQYQYTPGKYAFENYYPEVYLTEGQEPTDFVYFKKSDTLERKIQIKEAQYQPYRAMEAIFEKYQHHLAKNNLFYGCLKFETTKMSCYLFNVPKQLITLTNGQFRLRMNCKIINKTGLPQQLEVYYFIQGKQGHVMEFSISGNHYNEIIVELPIFTYGKKRKNYQLLLDVKLDQQAVYGNTSPYKIKMMNYLREEQVKLPKVVNKVGANWKRLQDYKYKIKHTAKQLPYVGKLLTTVYRWQRKNNEA